MADLGNPSSYQALKPGTPVFSSSGEEVGTVTHVLAVPEEDIFDGIVIETHLGPGGHRFVDAPEIVEIFERGVELKLGTEACHALPEPSENPAAMEVGADDMAAKGKLHDKLRRAWDLVSGNY